MVDAVLSRGGTSASIPLVSDGASLVTARDIGKPTLKTHATGSEEPRSQDYQNAQDVWTVTGVLTGSDAYSTAVTLAEDIIKPQLDSPLELDLSALENRGTYDVVPNGESALTLTYAPGRLNIVGVQVSLAVVANAYGGSQSTTEPRTPPSGDGIRVARGDTTVDLTVDIAVTRTVGRGSIELNPNTAELPVAIDENAPATDTFEISGVLLDSSLDAVTLEERILRERLGDSSLTLSFLGETYGLKEYDVVPVGSQAGRTAITAGAKDEVRVPTLELRTVTDS